VTDIIDLDCVSFGYNSNSLSGPLVKGSSKTLSHDIFNNKHEWILLDALAKNWTRGIGEMIATMFLPAVLDHEEPQRNAYKTQFKHPNWLYNRIKLLGADSDSGAYALQQLGSQIKACSRGSWIFFGAIGYTIQHVR
jgi:hypothetical protein